MSFFEDLLLEFFRTFIFDNLKWVGIGVKWLFYLGKRPISQIRKENWNTRIGFIVFILLILFIVYLAN